MNKWIMLAVIVAVIVAHGVDGAGAEEPAVQNEQDKNQTEEGMARPTDPGSPESKEGLPIHGKERDSIREALQEKIGTLSIHGGAVGYYQGTNDVTIGGEQFHNPDGAGFAADMEFAFEPLENGEMFIRVHAGEGSGADTSLQPFANLNTISDDNPDGDGISLLEVFYTQSFFNENFLLSIGKTEPFVFVDDNALANDEYAQFVGKPFVNNPVFDSEDEYAPLIAIGVKPFKQISMAFVCQSSSRPLLEEDKQKSGYDRIFDEPFFAGQFTYSPSIAGLEGNYRIYGWAQTYDHPRLTVNTTSEGWGIGLSLDQMVHEYVGFFARAGYQNKEVYEVPWFWSVGTGLKGILPKRDGDTLGFGVAGLIANDDLDTHGTEVHLECYYRVAFGGHFAVSPDIQYIFNPLGDSDNQGIVAGMLRAEASF